LRVEEWCNDAVPTRPVKIVICLSPLRLVATIPELAH
jgi:hypothetical protein